MSVSRTLPPDGVGLTRSTQHGENMGEAAAGAAVDVATATDHVDVSRMPAMITDDDVSDSDNDRQEIRWVATDNRAKCKQCGPKTCCEPYKCKQYTRREQNFFKCRAA